MRMQMERQFRVEKYLEMARLTTDASSREEFLEMARYTLELDESDFKTVNTRYPELNNYFSTVQRGEFIGRSVAETYRNYSQYCKENGEPILSKQAFNRCAEKTFGLIRRRGSFGVDRRNLWKWSE
ncbi:hypothetical protein [Levilactobacillus tujiorum]|uniref:hypothetical protein n=1 Tax=Levilactobacillus tujiorum TaxID=2912243 RepID=UPI0014566517|nr:hypothetical protein [Levilactobacillus tujiorum]NLR31363.1 hypothetical protein [Levilactobacillus tujiorum]